MYCNWCGHPNPDGSVFCSSCGKPMTPGQQSSPKNGTSLSSETKGYLDGQNGYAAYCAAKWRKLLASPLVLTFIIFFSAVLLLNLLQLNDLAETVSIYTQMLNVDLTENMSSSMVLVQLVLFVPSILIAIGMWLLYSQAYTSADRPVNSTGFSLIRGALFANMCATTLLLTVCFFTICKAFSEISAANNAYLSSVKSLLSGALIGVLLGIVLVVFYFYLLRKVLSRAKEAIEEIYPNTDGITPLAVIQFVLGGFCVITMLSSLTLTTVASACIPILCGVVLLKYKTVMQDLQYSYLAAFGDTWSGEQYLRADEDGKKLVYDTVPPWEWTRRR